MQQRLFISMNVDYNTYSEIIVAMEIKIRFLNLLDILSIYF